ncbi:MAG TPA: phosphatidate cytidylyltransferase [Acidobacteriota bacterium]|nr:phosphatidate cytidylyltransferase [Acidobacteriota bacterium]
MLTRIVVAAILIVATALMVELASTALFLGGMSLIAVLCVHELGGMFKSYRWPLYPTTYLLCLALPWVWVYHPQWIGAAVSGSFLVTVAFALLSMREVESGFAAASANVLTVLYLGLPLSILAHFRQHSHLEIWLLLVAIWAADSLALLVGRRWGTIKVTPLISPQKSLQGYLAAMAAALATAILLGSRWFPERGLLFWTLAGLTVGLFGILGDLFESVIKRGARIKDSSHLLPGHGGIMDRVDSMLFALPAYYLLSRLVE